MNVDELKIDTQGRFLVVKGKIEDNAFIIANFMLPIEIDVHDNSLQIFRVTC